MTAFADLNPIDRFSSLIEELFKDAAAEFPRGGSRYR
jgi:hypothetical protein